MAGLKSVPIERSTVVRAVARGGSGGLAEPPSNLMIFMTIVLTYGRIDGMQKYLRSTVMHILFTLTLNTFS